MENIQEPITFKEILILQEIQEREVNQPRKNGFVARKKNYVDLRGALMDEFMEFRKELPDNLNFKTWKEKQYSPQNQLVEFVDMLFFIMTEINMSNIKNNAIDEWDYTWEHYHFDVNINNSDIHFFMRNIIEEEILNLLKKYILLAKRLGYSEKDIIQQYWIKWQFNMTRINKDWSLSHEKN